MEYEITAGKRVGSKLIYAQNYLFKKNKVLKDGSVAFICYSSTCPARVIVNGQTCSLPKTEHNHSEMSALKEEFAVMNAMKERCANERLPSKQIYNEESSKSVLWLILIDLLTVPQNYTK